MNYGRFRGAGLAVAAALLAIGVSACDDDNGKTNNDLSVSTDLSVKTDMSADAAVSTPSTAQITVADVVGSPWVPFGDGGVPLSDPNTGTPIPTHTLAVIADFPVSANTSQHTSGTDALHGCTWSRYANDSASGPFPAPNENAGTVAITGYNTTTALAIDTANLNPPPFGIPAAPDATVNCALNTMTKQYGCFFGTDPTHSVDRYIFPTIPNPASPSPSPAYLNTDLIPSNSITETFTTIAGSSFSDSRSATLTGLLGNDQPFLNVALAKVNGTAVVAGFQDLEGKLDGSADVTLNYACTGATNGVCPQGGGVTGLLIETSLGAKWAAPDQTRFGTAQCVEQDGAAAASQTFTLTKEMIQDILGITPPPGSGLSPDTNTHQSIRIVLVRLVPAINFSGAHSLYFTAGRGVFGFVDQ